MSPFSIVQNGTHFSSSPNNNGFSRGLWFLRSPILTLAIFSVVFVICSRTIFWTTEQQQDPQKRISTTGIYHGEFTLSTKSNDERLKELSKILSSSSSSLSKHEKDSSLDDSSSSDSINSSSRRNSGEGNSSSNEDDVVQQTFIRKRQHEDASEFTLTTVANDARLDAMTEAMKTAIDDDDDEKEEEDESSLTSTSTSEDEGSEGKGKGNDVDDEEGSNDDHKHNSSDRNHNENTDDVNNDTPDLDETDGDNESSNDEDSSDNNERDNDSSDVETEEDSSRSKDIEEDSSDKKDIKTDSSDVEDEGNSSDRVKSEKESSDVEEDSSDNKDIETDSSDVEDEENSSYDKDNKNESSDVEDEEDSSDKKHSENGSYAEKDKEDRSDSDDGDSDSDNEKEISRGRKELVDQESDDEIDYDKSNNTDKNSTRGKWCTRQQIIDGKWVKDVLSKPPYVVSTVHLRCYPRDTYYDKKNGWHTWKWQPHEKETGQCDYESHFNKVDFCSLLPSGIVSIIGDSLSWEHYRSLVQLTGTSTHQGYQHQSRELYTNIFQSVCDKSTKILYRRDDKLQNVTGSILQDFPTVLVMNRGAHWVPDDELIPDIKRVIAELQEHWIPKCIEHKMKCHFFWRTAVPGHPFCYNTTKEKDKHGDPVYVPTYKEPINDLAYWENLIGNLSTYNNRSINFHWYDYQPQNRLVLSEFDKAFGELNATSPYFTYEVIDAYYLNIRRPDEHRAHQADCLHNCYPGKMDIYSILMLHYLKQQRTEHDVVALQRLAEEKQLWNFQDTTTFDPDATALAKKARMEREKADEALAPIADEEQN